jgi:hypothetical protein
MTIVLSMVVYSLRMTCREGAPYNSIRSYNVIPIKPVGQLNIILGVTTYREIINLPLPPNDIIPHVTACCSCMNRTYDYSP